MKQIPKIYLLIFTFLTSMLYGQRKEPYYSYFEILYGQKFVSHKTLNGEINSLDNLKFGGNLSYVGISLSGYVLVSRGTFFDHYGNLYYTQVIPQKIKINDSITSNVTGFNFGFTYFGFDIFPKQRTFNIYFTLGANTGRIRMFGNSLTTQKKPYFSPKLRLNPALTIKPFRLSLIVEYDFDISNKNWRKTNFSNSEKIYLPQTSNSGLTLLASVGYILNNKTKHKKSSIKVD